jgi:phage repressor protein C with HTH and peptisase S24 domain
MEIPNPHHNLDPEKHFIVRATGDSMNGGHNPIKDGDLILLEQNSGGTISNQIFAIEYQDEFGDTSYVLKRIEKEPNGSYQLISLNKDYPPIPVDPSTMKPFARLKQKL